jgi:hypothetical protein
VTSALKTRANRKNARKSTGPRSPAGKSVSAMNSVRHGILCERAPVLPTENLGNYRKLVASVGQYLSPVGPIEQELTQRIGTLMWRLRRLALTEASLFAWHQAEAAREEAVEARAGTIQALFDAGVELERVTDPVKHALAADQFRAAVRARRTPALMLAMALREDAPAFAVLTRYEATIEFRLARTLRQLHDLQARRDHETVETHGP